MTDDREEAKQGRGDVDIHQISCTVLLGKTANSFSIIQTKYLKEWTIVCRIKAASFHCKNIFL